MADKEVLFSDEHGNSLWCVRDYTEDLSEVLDGLELLKNPPVRIMGRVSHQRRSVGFYSDAVDSYPYSGQEIIAQQPPRELQDVMLRINRDYGVDVNAALVNRYVDGKDYISPHRDNQPIIDQSYVYTLSYGATRDFVVTDYETGKMVYTFAATPRTLLCMEGPTFQKLYKHGLPVRSRVTEPRTSITLRHHYE